MASHFLVVWEVGIGQTPTIGNYRGMGKRVVIFLFSSSCQLPVVVLVDVSDKWTRNQLSPEVLQCLTQFSQVPSILVMNKVSTTYPRKESTFL